MTRTILDRQLQALSEQILAMWALSDQVFEKGLEALKQQDAPLCQVAINYQPLIKAARVDIEKMAFSVLTLQQPLGGRDLRFVASIPTIAAELERIGEGGVAAASILMQIFCLRGPQGASDSKAPPAPGEAEELAMPDLLGLGEEARRLLGVAFKAFAACDARAASAIRHGEQLLTHRYEYVRDELIEFLTQMQTLPLLRCDEQSPRRVAYMLSLANRLARVADHCDAICERTVFIARGTSREGQRETVTR